MRKMTKQEQIEEMTKLIRSKEGIYREEIYPCEDDIRCEKCSCLYKIEAEALYEVGYRRIREKDKTLEEQIKHLNTIVERLDELLAKGIDEYIMGIDGVEGLKDMWERAAVMEFAEKVKEKYSVYDDRHILYRIIDELLKEYE